MILDDATSEIYYAQLVEEESTVTVMAALREVIERKGLFCALYSDRGSHFWLTPKAGDKVDPHRLTQVGRALRDLGVQMIPAYSPQARGRSERQLRNLAGTAAAGAPVARGSAPLRKPTAFCASTTSGRSSTAASRWPCGAARHRLHRLRPRRDLDLIFSLQFERTVSRDNTVSFQNLALQIDKVSWRGTLAGCNVIVHQHLDGTLSMTHGPRRLEPLHQPGHRPITQTATKQAVEKPLRGKVQKPTFPPRLEIPQTAPDSHFPTATTAAR